MAPSNPDPIGSDLARARRTRQLRRDAVCVLCGERNATVLKRAARSLLERHHLAGRVNDTDMTVILCLNCHRRLTSQQRSLGVELDADRQRADIEKAISVLRGLAQFFDLLARWLMMWAERLTAHVERLDADFPGWRTNELGKT